MYTIHFFAFCILAHTSIFYMSISRILEGVWFSFWKGRWIRILVLEVGEKYWLRERLVILIGLKKGLEGTNSVGRSF